MRKARKAADPFQSGQPFSYQRGSANAFSLWIRSRVDIPVPFGAPIRGEKRVDKKRGDDDGPLPSQLLVVTTKKCTNKQVTGAMHMVWKTQGGAGKRGGKKRVDGGALWRRSCW